MTGLGSAGGYVGDGVGTANLAGRTLAASITGQDSELLRLPWFGHVPPRWEPEPLRWLGVNAGLLVARAADAAETVLGRRTPLSTALAGSRRTDAAGVRPPPGVLPSSPGRSVAGPLEGRNRWWQHDRNTESVVTEAICLYLPMP